MTLAPYVRACWCGNADLASFNSEYGHCEACGTLVLLNGLSIDQLQGSVDDSHFYGKRYWLDHQNKDLGLPDIHVRARNDLTERNLHWLKALLKYRLPPAKVLELGCSHGGFVALLRQAGYDASGVEMSAWVVEFGRQAFGVPIAMGPVESLDIECGSLDIIVLMDVLEHLSDPVATMAHCLKLLRPDGLLMVQTPLFKEEIEYEALVESNSKFLEMLIPNEHIYLFSDHSVARLFHQLGAEYIQFEPAIFGHYDMFFLVGRLPIVPIPVEKAETLLLSSPQGRIVQAMLELRARELELVARLQESELDRAARLEQITTLTSMLRESEADRAAREKQIETLTRLLQARY